MSVNVTVALPTRNRYNFLVRCLESLNKQTYKNFRVLVSNNGSRDETSRFDSSAFPDLDIRIVHRNPSLPGLAEHYQVLFSEVDTPWMALAHDDEIYHPEWLEVLLSQCNEDTVLSMGQILLRDLRDVAHPRYHLSKGNLSPGIYTSSEIKLKALKDGETFSGQAFLLRTDTISAGIDLINSYEQYDYALLMQCSALGNTVVSKQILATYTLHLSNTLGSKEYIAEYCRRIQSCEMLREWLIDVANELPEDEVKLVNMRLFKSQLHGEMRVLLKNYPTLTGEEWKILTTRMEANPFCSLSVRLALLGLSLGRVIPSSIRKWILTKLFNHRGVRALPNEIKCENVELVFKTTA